MTLVEFSRLAKPTERIRLDKYMDKAGLGISRSQIQKLIKEGHIRINGRIAKPHTLLNRGDEISVKYEKPKQYELKPSDITLDIIYEDNDIIVVNKPPGMVTHPAPGHSDGTLVNALLAHCILPDGISGRTRPGVLHRLDKDTSGLLVFAKSNTALLGIAKQIETRKVQREYIAFTWNDIQLKEGIVDAPIGRYTFDRKTMAVTPLRSREAITRFKVTRRFKIVTELAVKLETGRTHQIRVHLSHIGHPVVGDPTYGGRKNLYNIKEDFFNKIMEIIPRQALHAGILGFEHPISGKYLEFNSKIPQDMQKLHDYLQDIQKTFKP